MKSEWVPIEKSKELDKILDPIRDTLTKKFKSKKIDTYIYKNPEKLVAEHSAHLSRQITGEGVLSPKLMKKIRREHFNLVFLFIIRKRQDVHVLVKPTHNILESEVELSKTAGRAKLGPKFLFSMDSPLGLLIFEDFLSMHAGWRKLYMVWPGVMRHKSLFAKCFGTLLGKLHKKAILYAEIFETHLFANFPEHECRLTDFGISRYGTPKETEEELNKALDLLKKKRFPARDQAEFLKAYSKHKKLPKRFR